jgi:IS4 transposase
LIRYWDQENQRELIFLTNKSWTAQTVADIYKERWNIEVFFKQIKQNLKIKSFTGTSPNAVMIHVWTAMITMLLLLFLKAKAKFGWNLSNLAVFLRLHLLVKIDLWDWLDDPFFNRLKHL